MPRAKWVTGDGGPAIVLQAGAVRSWRGAADFERSRMMGGDLETDYDVVCDREGDDVGVIERRGRAMLVLGDCSWASRFVPTSGGHPTILQHFGSDRSDRALVSHLLALPAEATHRLLVRDRTLRLMVAADAGREPFYRFLEHAIAPGPTLATVHASPEGQVVLLRPDTTPAGSSRPRQPRPA